MVNEYLYQARLERLVRSLERIVDLLEKLAVPPVIVEPPGSFEEIVDDLEAIVYHQESSH